MLKIELLPMKYIQIMPQICYGSAVPSGEKYKTMEAILFDPRARENVPCRFRHDGDMTWAPEYGGTVCRKKVTYFLHHTVYEFLTRKNGPREIYAYGRGIIVKSRFMINDEVATEDKYEEWLNSVPLTKRAAQN